jgi:Na+/H+ antiporter NhaD/arsenite permease-like protein
MAVEWWAAIPFALLLVAIAVLPLIPATAHHWERNSVKLAVALVLGLPVASWYLVSGAGSAIGHAVVEYLQFITLLLALFVISGGIFLTGDIRATPRANTIFLAIGAVAASFVGTTGAAMLLIRPLLNTNAERAHKVHTVVFTIFIVANSGGMLTPLGDPPLFLGMLRGVPFTWTFGLWPQWLLVNILLLAVYYGLDRRAYARETLDSLVTDDLERTPLGLRGAINLAFLVIVVGAVAWVPSIDLHALEAGHAGFVQLVPWREIAMLAAIAGSLLLGDRVARYELNQFTWSPILEVAALFVGIFLAMVPALDFLRRIAPTLPLNELTTFVFTGGLSAFLDNAPTYATFFEIASQLPGEPRVAGVPEGLLAAVSLGAVLGGALTYIGNGPNFLTKAVAESAGVPMPSFGGYLRWSVRYLLPVLVVMALIFLVDGLLWTGLGAVGALALLGHAAIRSAFPRAS